jgi:hypothetical protein
MLWSLCLSREDREQSNLVYLICRLSSRFEIFHDGENSLYFTLKMEEGSKVFQITGILLQHYMTS